MRRSALIFLLLLIALLLAGTLKISWLTNTYATFDIPISGMDRFQAWLYAILPYDSARGEEGVTAQGALLIGLLILIGATAWLGMENIFAGFNRWTWISLALVALTNGACRGPKAPAAASAVPELPGDQTRCHLAANQESPLVTEWPASEKANLEARLGEGAVVVAYSGCSLRLLPACRYYAYIQVTEEEQNLWQAYETLSQAYPNFALRKVSTAAEIYPVFRDLFRKEGAPA